MNVYASIWARAGSCLWKLRLLVISMRPRQWTKNLFLLAGLLFSGQVFEIHSQSKAWLAFAIFSLLSGGIYLINDSVDIDRDKLHPTKRLRPLAAGWLSKEEGLAFASVLIVSSFLLTLAINPWFTSVAFFYFILSLLYSFWLKKLVILDVMTIAAGFILRVTAGAVAIRVEISYWIVLCSGLLALFLALGKRRHELITLADHCRTRPGLEEYRPSLLDQMISIVTAAAILAYSLYAYYGPQGSRMLISVPFVIYGIFRYLYLIHRQNGGGSPEEVLLKDTPFIFNILLWLVTVMTVIYDHGPK